jgi:hypothetical protein
MGNPVRRNIKNVNINDVRQEGFTSRQYNGTCRSEGTFAETGILNTICILCNSTVFNDTHICPSRISNKFRVTSM